MRQTCPRGQFADAPAHRQRPDTPDGLFAQLVVLAMLSHASPPPHAELQPPQLFSLVEMFTAAPSQQTSAATFPHCVPFDTPEQVPCLPATSQRLQLELQLLSQQ